MKTVLFNQNVKIDFLQGVGEEVFYAGKEYPMEDDQADRWIRRGKAADVALLLKEDEPEPNHEREMAELTAKAKARQGGKAAKPEEAKPAEAKPEDGKQ